MDLYAQNGLIPAILRTERLTLRPVADTDSAAIVTAMGNRDVAKWLTTVPHPYSAQDARDFIAHTADPDTGHHWAIACGDTLIGMISLDEELGYWLDAAWHGQGLMTEAATAVISAWFANTTEPLVSGHFVRNAASRAVLLKLGFRDTHVEEAIRRADNRKIKLQRMLLTHADWRTHHG